MRHGAKVKLCSHEGCANQVVNGGGKLQKKRCSQEGCTNQSTKGGVGVCTRHGAYRNTNDESNAFESEFEQTTAAQSQPNGHASRSPIIGQGVAQGVPGEVAILCQEIFEV